MGDFTHLNWERIVSNLIEAIEQLEDLVEASKDDDPPSEAELQIALYHAYHHINFAWNVRHLSSARYALMTDEDFETWGRYPTEVENLAGDD